MKRVLAGLLVALGFALLAGYASADPIGPNCGSCQGGIYSLTYSGSKILPDNDANFDVYQINYHMDLTGFTGSQANGAFVHGVSFKLGTNNIVGASLQSAPNGVGSWTGPVVDEQINNSGTGCGGGGNGWICTDYTTSTGVDFTGLNPKTLDWVFLLTVTEGNSPDASGSIKAIFVNNSGNKIGDILSEEISLQTGNEIAPGSTVVVPGPAPLVLIGLGLMGLAVARRRR